MTRIVAFLIAVGVSMGLGIASGEPDPVANRLHEIRTPTPLAWVKHAQTACGGTLARRWEDGIWRCVLSDEFDGAAVDLTRWTVVTTADSGFSSGIPPSFACYVYDPRTVSVAGGYLNLTVLDSGNEFLCGGPAAQPTRYIGGAISTKNRLSQTYGRYEVRARFPTDERKGLQSSIVLWADHLTDVRTTAEIDVAEFFTRWPDRVIPYVRYDERSKDSTATNNHCLVERPDRFHRYTIQWTPDQIDIWVDGHSCLSTTWSNGVARHPAPFDQPFNLALFQAFGVSRAGYDMDEPAHLPATMQVDYVHIWGQRDD